MRAPMRAPMRAEMPAGVGFGGSASFFLGANLFVWVAVQCIVRTDSCGFWIEYFSRPPAENRAEIACPDCVPRLRAEIAC